MQRRPLSLLLTHRIFKVGLVVLATSAAVTQHAAVVKLLRSPSSTPLQQAATIIDLCGDDLNATGQNFIAILSENRRLTLLPQISHQFEVMKANREKAVDVDVAAAQPLDAAAATDVI